MPPEACPGLGAQSALADSTPMGADLLGGARSPGGPGQCLHQREPRVQPRNADLRVAASQGFVTKTRPVWEQEYFVNPRSSAAKNAHRGSNAPPGRKHKPHHRRKAARSLRTPDGCRATGDEACQGSVVSPWHRPLGGTSVPAPHLPLAPRQGPASASAPRPIQS